MAKVKVTGALFKGKVTKEIQKAVERTAEYAKGLLEQENRRVAYKTGKMSRSWRVTPIRRGIKIVNKMPYSGFVVNGTKRMRARPIVDNVMPDIRDKFDSELSKIKGE